MTLTILLLFISDIIAAQHSTSYAKGIESASDESAILSSIDDRDTFCKGNGNVIFPDPYNYNIYYRCRRQRRETWKCIGDLSFDRKTQRCSPATAAESRSETGEACRQQRDGLYPLYDTNCKKYVRCKEGVAVEEKQCRTNELFSFGLQSCRAGDEVKCVRSVCEPTNDGFFALSGSNCRAYYLCRKGVRLDFVCPKGQTFDLRAKSCADGGICYEQTCVGRTDGVYADTTHDCARYFRCKGGELVETISCPKSTKHNGFACVTATRVRCEKPEKTAIAFYNRRNDECKLLADGSHVVRGTDCRKIRICLGGRTAGVSECPEGYRFHATKCFPRDVTGCDDACSEKPDGFYADETKACREYYQCFNGKVKERKKCENGSAFDGKLCYPSSLVICRKKSNETACEGLRDGFHADYLNGCRNYFYCYNQQIIIMNACPEGMRWNGSRCVNKHEYRCDTPRAVPRCKGEAAGLYQDFSSNCTDYFYCNGGEGIVLSCGKGEVYDGVKCRNSNEYTCPSAIRDECYDRSDGYRQDENSDCRSYFFCSRGSKITYICPGNSVFNGTNCVSPKEYTCPYRTDDCVGKFDGYYPDEATGCRKYFYCLQGRRVTTIGCGGKKIFNGEACVLANDVKAVCRRAAGDPCHRRMDGKYSKKCEGYIECRDQVLIEEKKCPRSSATDKTISSGDRFAEREKLICGSNKPHFITDYNSGCKNYYFCIGNLKMFATCPGGTIFNGRVCQEVSSYRCPKTSDVH